MSSQSIATVRDKFEAEYSIYSDKYHVIDVQRVRTNDWQVKRFLLAHNDDTEKAFTALCKTLQWKKNFGVHDRSDADFPLEWWQMCAVEITGSDYQGSLIHWGTTRKLISFRNAKAQLITKQFMVNNIEQLDADAGEAGFILICDNGGAGASNVDLEMIKFAITVLEHYPNGLRGAYSVNLPSIINTLMKLVMTFMPAKLRQLVHFISADELREFIDPKYIPRSLKGDREKLAYPDGLVPLKQCYREFGLDDKVFIEFSNMVVD